MFRVIQLMTISTLLLAIGCVKRTERITIFADGSAKFETTIEGDPEDVYEGDAMPSDESGWEIHDKTETDDDGKEKRAIAGGSVR